MDNKYYTPTIDEFHVGFEYEVRNEIGKNEWSSYEFDKRFYQLYSFNQFNLSIDDEIRNNNIRVKYLDREDIESLGWKYDNIRSNTPGENDGVFRLKSNDRSLGMRFMHIKREDGQWIPLEFPMIDILEWYDMGHSHPLFRGIIKNKSELKKLMKQLEIDG